jgi:hypothetical protein
VATKVGKMRHIERENIERENTEDRDEQSKKDLEQILDATPKP